MLNTASGVILNFTGRILLSISLLFIALPVYAAQADIEKRINRIERLLNNQNLLQMYTTQQTLKQEISGLRGDLDVLRHDLEQIKKQQKDIYIDLDSRMQDLEQSVSSLRSITPMPALPTSPGAGIPTTPPTPGMTDTTGDISDPATAIAQDSLSEQESYQGALAVLKNSQYEEAIQAFQVFLISYPQSDYAPNAQYWMAEAYYVLKDYESAISQFKKVISAYPGSRKTADSHLKIGFSYYELKDWKNAQAALESVLSDFPSSTAARLADRRLQKMKLEGHI